MALATIAEGFDAEAEQIEVTAAIFGLDPAELTLVSPIDHNENGFVCASTVAGRHVGTGGVRSFFQRDRHRDVTARP